MEALANQRKALLEEKKESDLQLVKKFCKQHGFNATQLRSVQIKRLDQKAQSSASNTSAQGADPANQSIRLTRLQRASQAPTT